MKFVSIEEKNVLSARLFDGVTSDSRERERERENDESNTSESASIKNEGFLYLGRQIPSSLVLLGRRRRHFFNSIGLYAFPVCVVEKKTTTPRSSRMLFAYSDKEEE